MSENAPFPLHDAAARGDTDALSRLLSQGVSVDAADEEGRTPLLTAAAYGRVNAVRLLLSCGADLNQVICLKRRIPAPEEREKLRKIAELFGVEVLSGGSNPNLEPRPAAYEVVRAAILSGDPDTLAAVLEAGGHADGAAYAPSEAVPIQIAASRERLDMIRLLIHHGANVNAVDTKGNTALVHAVRRKRIEVARCLLELGADPDIGTSQPILSAIVRRDVEMVRLLLASNAKLTSTREGSASPAAFVPQGSEMQALIAAHRGTDWHEAVARGELANTRLRRIARASKKGRNGNGDTALLNAAGGGDTAMVELLLDGGAKINGVNHSRETPLLGAVANGHVGVVRLLVERGAKIHATDHFGNTAIFLAADDDKGEIREILTAAGARIGIVEAAKMGDSIQVMKFLANGVPVDQRNESGVTALMTAIGRGDTVLAALLHEKGADVELQDGLQNTPLHYAVKHGLRADALNMPELVLRWGADSNKPGENGETVLRIAIRRRSEKMVRFLLQNGADPNERVTNAESTLLHEIIRWGRGDLNTIRALLDYGADTEAADKIGSTPLMDAVQLNPMVTRRELTDVQAAREYGRAVVRLLIERGANVNAEYRTGTVLSEAAQAGDVEVVRLLLDAGADPNGGGVNREPLTLAIRRGHQEVADLLRERGAHDTPVPDFPPEIPEGPLDALGKIRVETGSGASFTSFAVKLPRQKGQED